MAGPPLQVISADTAPWSDDDALAQARTLVAEQLNATVLAAAWGWHRSKVQRRLKRWAKEGLIVPPAKGRPGAKKRVGGRRSPKPAAPAASAADGAGGAETTTDVAAEGEPSAEAASVPEGKTKEEAAGDAPASSAQQEISTPVQRLVLAILLGGTAIALGGVGMLLNIRFAYSFGGDSMEAGVLLASLGGVIDVLTLVLPSAGALLWESRARLSALATWFIFVLVMCMSLLAACGFASTQVGDSVQNRNNVTEQRAALLGRLERLRGERAAIAEMRSIAAIDAALQAAPAAAEGVWKQTKGCQDVTLKDSAKACGAVIALRQARGEALRRDALDTEISQAEDGLAKLPAFASADPGADMAAKLLSALTAGYVRITSDAIEQVRIAGLTVMPAAAGILLSFAQLLCRAPRCRRGGMA